MNLYSLSFVFFATIIFVYFLLSTESINKTKKCIGIFWLFMLIVLLYGMLFETSRGFIILFKKGFWIFICIFLLGIISVILEKRYKNVSITYILIFYFGIPLLYAVSMIYPYLTHTLALESPSETIFYCGFFLFAFLSIIGFFSWIKEKYVILRICLICCLFFYFPFLPFASIIFQWIDK